jgi:hypothetical protein
MYDFLVFIINSSSMKKKKSLNEMFETICGVKINEDFDGGGASIFIPDAEGNSVAGGARNYDDHNMQDNAESGEESNINDFGESAGVDETNATKPFAQIADYFKKYYQIDVTGLNPKIVEKIYKQWDELSDSYDGLSDVEENPDGSLSAEFEGMFGKHWKSFKNHAEFDEYYNKTFKEPLKADFNNLYKKYSSEIEKRKADTAASANTLGNMNPDAFNKLKTNMGTLNERVLKVFLGKQ